MAATHIVKHRRLYLAVDGELQHFPEGKQLTLTKEQAEKLGGRVASLKDEAPVNLSEKKEKKDK